MGLPNISARNSTLAGCHKVTGIMSTVVWWVTVGLLVAHDVLLVRFEVGERSLPARVFSVGPNSVWAYRNSVAEFYLGTSTQCVRG